MQIKELDDAVVERLRVAANDEGMSLSAFLRRELTVLAEDMQLKDRLGDPVPALVGVRLREIVDALREERDRQ